jgi:peptidoglycan/LPS O-acetylase OafA/YrhL
MVCIIIAHLSGAALVVDGVYAGGFKAGYGAITGTVLAGLQLALPLFFVLSGYLISRPFVRAFLLGRPVPSLVAYLRHRCARILPVFWVLGGLMLVYYGALGSKFTDILGLFGLVQTYLPTNGFDNFLGQAWTIDMEVAFYVSVPLGALLLRAGFRRWAGRPGNTRTAGIEQRAALLIGLLVGLTVLSAWLRSITITSQFWSLSPPSTFYYFGPGVILAALEVRYGAALARGRLPRLTLVLGLLALVIAVTLAVIAPAQDDHRLISFPGALAVTFGAACAFGSLLVLQIARGACPRLLSNRVSRWLGARSYPAYIIQSAVIAEALRLHIGQIGPHPRRTLVELAAFGLPITLAAAAVVHARFERPILDWAHRKRPSEAASRPAPLIPADSPAAADTTGVASATVESATVESPSVESPAAHSPAAEAPLADTRAAADATAVSPDAGGAR